MSSAQICTCLDEEAEAARHDPRLPTVRRLMRRAIKAVDGRIGWYVDVYQDEDGSLKVGDYVSTGFKTHPRQDGIHVIFRAEEFSGRLQRDRETWANAVLDAVIELRRE